MSLINDALKQAQKAPPEDVSKAFTPMQPVTAAQSPAATSWFLPAIVLLLIGAAVFFIGWVVVHQSARDEAERQALAAATPRPVITTQMTIGSQPTTTKPPLPVQPQPAITPAPAVQPQPVSTPPPSSAPVFVLKLQGIDYSPTAPSAILNGKTVHPGDTFRQYHVKAISQTVVTLIDADKKEIQIELGN